MEGDAELLRLAELLTLGAVTARQVADYRGRDRDQIYALSEQAETMAASLREMCRRGTADESMN